MKVPRLAGWADALADRMKLVIVAGGGGFESRECDKCGAMIGVETGEDFEGCLLCGNNFSDR